MTTQEPPQSVAERLLPETVNYMRAFKRGQWHIVDGRREWLATSREQVPRCLRLLLVADVAQLEWADVADDLCPECALRG